MLYHSLQFLFLRLSKCIPVLLPLLSRDMVLNITSMLGFRKLGKCFFFHEQFITIADIQLWMIQNLLRLNDNKTIIIYLASLHYLKFLKTPSLEMSASLITPKGSVKNLAVFLDKCINMSHHYSELPTTILRTFTV